MWIEPAAGSFLEAAGTPDWRGSSRRPPRLLASLGLPALRLQAAPPGTARDLI